jgi:hypothetical protein
VAVLTPLVILWLHTSIDCVHRQWPFKPADIAAWIGIR